MLERVTVTDFGDDKAPVWDSTPIPFTHRQHIIKHNPLVLSLFSPPFLLPSNSYAPRLSSYIHKHPHQPTLTAGFQLKTCSDVQYTQLGAFDTFTTLMCLL